MAYELGSVRVFVAVAESLSFRVAGERLGVTRSAVSQSLRRLEDDLGVARWDEAKALQTPSPPLGYERARGRSFFTRRASPRTPPVASVSDVTARGRGRVTSSARVIPAAGAA